MTDESSDSRAPAVRPLRLLALAAIYLVIAHVLPPPDGIDPQSWRRVAVFFATIGGLMLQPLPGSPLVIVGVVAMMVLGGLPIDRALDGYSAPTVWMVLMAMLMSRALRESGLARRIALWFIRAIGRTSLGLGYALHLTDLTLATGVPSITARSASIVFPIARSISSLYQSNPGASSAVLGAFLMTCLYQGSVISSAMFFYSSAANLLLGDLAGEYAGVTITWTSWFIAGLGPGIASSIVVPYLVYRMMSPELKRTPAASQFASEQLAALGPIRGREAIVGLVFIGLIGFWVASSYISWLSPTVVAFLGITVLFVTRALSWDSALNEHSAWDVFVWYGGLLMMGGVLNETGVTTLFAEWFGSWFPGTSWVDRLPGGAGHLLLRPLLLRQHHRARDRVVSPVRGTADESRRAGAGSGLQPGVHQQPDRRSDALWHHDVAGHLHRRLCHAERLVACRILRVGRESCDRADGRDAVVADAGILVGRPPAPVGHRVTR